jgi:hypothetical protein
MTAFPKPTPRDKARKVLRRTSSQLRTNRERKRLSHEIQFSGGVAHSDWIRSKLCVLMASTPELSGCDGRTEAAHVTSRGAGGKWFDVVPLCSGHHRDQHAGRFQTGTLAFLRSAAKACVADHLRSIGAI